MKRLGSTLFLRIAVILIGVPILALCILLLPKIVIEAIEQAKDGAMLGFSYFPFY